MDQNKILALYRIADRMERYTVDKGPMGESKPFKIYATELRKIASEENSSKSSPTSSQFDDDGLYLRWLFSR